MRVVVSALVAVSFAGVLLAAPAPFSRQAAEIQMVIGTKTPSPRWEEVDDFDVTLALRNATGARVNLPLNSYSGKLEDCSGLTFVLRFPDGAVVALRSWIDSPPVYRPDQPKDGARPGPKFSAFSLPARGSASAVSEVLSRRREPFWLLFRQHKGQFCLTVTIPKAGLKSNTIRYHDCLASPASFDPLEYIGR